MKEEERNLYQIWNILSSYPHALSSKDPPNNKPKLVTCFNSLGDLMKTAVQCYEAL